MGSSCCFEGLAALGRRGVMLPAPSYVQSGSRFARSHRDTRTSKLLRAFDLSEGSELGEGSFGTVVRTRSKETGSACVLKKIDKREMPDEVLGCLADEIAIHGVCDHPNIVRIFESFESDSHIHIALEICEGGEVFSLLQDQGSLCEADATLVMQQVLRAVLYLHEVKQVAHRDLKLENLLLKSRGIPLKDNTVKVIDFGFAASFTPGQRSFCTRCGTPAYMAPEIMSGPYDEKCDIWSCGIMLYELLSGDVPFNAPSIRELLRMSAHRSLRFHTVLWRLVSESAKVLIQSMCEKNPSWRISAEEALRSSCVGRDPEGVAGPAVAPPQPEPQHRGGGGRSIAENLRAFSSLDDFQKAALRLAAYRLEDQQTAEQRTAFGLLDRNGDGRLTPEEVREGCPEIGLSAAEARELFRGLDVDGSGCLEYSEFIGAAVSKDSLPHHACWEAFRFCDQDGSGSISAKEVSEVLCSHASSDGASGHGEEEMDFPAFAAMLRGARAGGA